MGPLTETFCRRWPELSNGMLNFLLRWEAEHPACGATRHELDVAVRMPYHAGWNDGISKGQDCQPFRGVKAFWRALGQEQPEDERDTRIAELEALCHEPMHCASCAAAMCREENLRNALMDKAREFAEQYELAETRKLAQEALEQKVRNAEAEIARLKTPLPEDLEASARWLEEKATPSKQAQAASIGTEQGLLRAEAIEHIRILLAGTRGLQVEIDRLKAREVTKDDVTAILLAARVSRFDHEQDGLAKFREIMAAKGGEAPIAQPIPEEAVRAILEAGVRGACPPPGFVLQPNSEGWREMLAAAIAEAAKWRPHKPELKVKP